MFKLLTKTPNLLQEGNVVLFSNNFNKNYEKKIFRVTRMQQIEFDRHFILESGDSYDFDLLDKDDGFLEPRSKNTLYEILVGIKPSFAMFYVRAPTTSYYAALETPGAHTELNDSTKRYLGAVSGTLTPYDSPRFRMHLVDEITPSVLRFYNDTDEVQKYVIKQLINRVRIQEIRSNELTQNEKDRIRKITHTSLVGGSQWGAVGIGVSEVNQLGGVT